MLQLKPLLYNVALYLSIYTTMYRTTRFGSVQSGSTATITLNDIFKLIGQCTHGFKARNTAIQLNMVFRGLGD